MGGYSGMRSYSGRGRAPDAELAGQQHAAVGQRQHGRDALARGEACGRYAAAPIPASEKDSPEAGEEHEAGRQPDGIRERCGGVGGHLGPALARILGAEQVAPESQQQHPVPVEHQRAVPRAGVGGGQLAPGIAAVVATVRHARFRGDVQPLLPPAGTISFRWKSSLLMARGVQVAPPSRVARK